MDGPVESRERLLTLVRGYRISQAIYVATRLGIPDLLADGPREIEELAQATGSHPPSQRRGRERTPDEYATLLARGGFRLAQVISLGRLPEGMGHQLIEGQPV